MKDFIHVYKTNHIMYVLMIGGHTVWTNVITNFQKLLIWVWLEVSLSTFFFFSFFHYTDFVICCK